MQLALAAGRGQIRSGKQPAAAAVQHRQIGDAVPVQVGSLSRAALRPMVRRLPGVRGLLPVRADDAVRVSLRPVQIRQVGPGHQKGAALALQEEIRAAVRVDVAQAGGAAHLAVRLANELP